MSISSCFTHTIVGNDHFKPGDQQLGRWKFQPKVFNPIFRFPCPRSSSTAAPPPARHAPDSQPRYRHASAAPGKTNSQFSPCPLGRASFISLLIPAAAGSHVTLLRPSDTGSRHLAGLETVRNQPNFHVALTCEGLVRRYRRSPVSSPRSSSLGASPSAYLVEARKYLPSSRGSASPHLESEHSAGSEGDGAVATPGAVNCRLAGSPLAPQ